MAGGHFGLAGGGLGLGGGHSGLVVRDKFNFRKKIKTTQHDTDREEDEKRYLDSNFFCDGCLLVDAPLGMSLLHT